MHIYRKGQCPAPPTTIKQEGAPMWSSPPTPNTFSLQETVALLPVGSGSESSILVVH